MAPQAWEEKARQKEMSEYAFIGYILAAVIFIATVAGFIVVLSRINERHCFKCGGTLSQAYLIGDSRKDLVICNKCETLFREVDGYLTEVFGIPPQLIEGENKH